MNSVNLVGRLTRDPELTHTANGTAVCRLGLAVPRRDRDAEPVYVEVKAFDGQAQASADHLERGRLVAISGRVETDKWEAADGARRSMTYVVARRVEFLDRTSSRHAVDSVADAPGELQPA